MLRISLLILLLIPSLVLSQNPLDKVFAEDNFLKELGDNRDKYEIQVIYTQIDRNSDQTPVLTTYEWGTDSSRYYYPASTVKMPAAFLALEKINQLNIVGLDAHSKLEIGAGSEPQTPFSYDSTAADGTASIAQFIKQIFVVSDNNAHNRLYEFIGQEQFNRSLHRKGFTNTRVVHRLGPGGFPFNPKTNQSTNPMTFFDESGKMLYHQGEASGQTPYQLALKDQIRGKAHMRNGELVDQPFDFSQKNFFALKDMHDVLRAVIFPEITPARQRFDIAVEDYDFLYEWMCKLPNASGIPQYAGKSDGYVKFFIYGDREEETIPDHIKIFNKVGWAYGYLTDVSYIIDRQEGLEFFLAATIHVNENETYNDGEYEYEEVGLPFFGVLGRAIYEYEKQRPRTVKPDLSRF